MSGVDSLNTSLCFTQSELIEPVLPQAAQLGIHFLIIFLSQHAVRDAPPLRDLIKDTPLVKERKVGRDREKEEEEFRKPSTRREPNPRPPEHEACALPLCYNRGPVA